MFSYSKYLIDFKCRFKKKCKQRELFKLVLICLTVDVEWITIMDIVLNFKLMINHCLPEDRQLRSKSRVN